MMAAQPKAPPGRPKIGIQNIPISKPMTLADAGIDKNLANRARKPGTKRGTTRDIGNPASLADAGIDKNLASRGAHTPEKSASTTSMPMFSDPPGPKTWPRASR